ncbi:GNAT family N-acetyltransferase [Marivita sp.]|uniref:GNAT family N-acetyltransferase n=1 Tax=Marivita sp. TaxID=2003365 RepID=UPI003F6D3AA0
MTPEVLSEADAPTLKALGDLCMRSKAHWGYDNAFMAACADVLRITKKDLKHPFAIIRVGPKYAGITQVTLHKYGADLSKLFVCPDHMGKGVGSALVTWAKALAHAAGHADLKVESDPAAEAFYARHGAIRIGLAPSEAIPGRMLPLLSIPTHPS